MVRIISNIPVLWTLDGKLIGSKLSGNEMSNMFLVCVSSIFSFSLLFLQPASVWWIWIHCLYLVESCQYHQCLSSNGAVASSCQPRHSGWSRRFGLFSVILIFHSFSNHSEIILEQSLLFIILNIKTASHVLILFIAPVGIWPRIGNLRRQ